MKGKRDEMAIVAMLREVGLEAQRVPRSGAAGGEFTGDIVCCGERFEAKLRAGGFKRIYDWLGDHYGLFLRADRKESLVVIRARDFAQLLKFISSQPAA
jgi:hypothetical protein